MRPRHVQPPTRRASRQGRSRVRRLYLEVLEDRTLPSCSLTLTPSLASPQLVGDQIDWTATPSDCSRETVYQFSVGYSGQRALVSRDFSPSNTFMWTPPEEGGYNVTVVAKEGYQGTDLISATVPDQVNARVTGPNPVVTPTANPLVALFSAPPSTASSMHVEFAALGHHEAWQSTAEAACPAGLSNNFLVAGMLPNTTYQMRAVASDGTMSALVSFTTGSLPSNIIFPTFNVLQPPNAASALQDDMVFHMLIPRVAKFANPTASDLQGHVNWYYDATNSGLLSTYPVTLLPGGDMLMFASDAHSPDFMSVYNVLQEIDLAGDPIRETNMDAINAQLQAMGQRPTYGFHHDAKRLPNGDTAILALTHQTVIINGQRATYLGDDILILNQDFQVVWVWDSFDHLDVTRGPTLGETDMNGNVDWMHANAISWSPTDNNLLLSIRNQDWVIKIDYNNRLGDGHVIWRMGPDGDFTVVGSNDPYPWFSHQHDMKLIGDSTLVVFDNGNTRCVGDPTCDSRGQEWQFDETTMTATPLLSADLGVYSNSVGAAEALPNGNFSFDAGLLGNGTHLYSQTIEVLPDGSLNYILEQTETGEYRSFRVQNLYDGTNPYLDYAPSPAPALPAATGLLAGPAAVPVSGLPTGAAMPSRTAPVLGGESSLVPVASVALVPSAVYDPLAGAVLDRAGDGLSVPLGDEAWLDGSLIG